MFIVMQDKELLNSEHVVKFKIIKGSNTRPFKLIAMLKEYKGVCIYEGTEENVNIAMDNLIEALVSKATVIDYSNNKEVS